MNALANLIKKITKRQLTMARTVSELSDVLDRTITFAQGENPYLSESDVAEIAAVVPETEAAEEATEEAEAVDTEEPAEEATIDAEGAEDAASE